MGKVASAQLHHGNVQGDPTGYLLYIAGFGQIFNICYVYICCYMLFEIKSELVAIIRSCKPFHNAEE